MLILNVLFVLVAIAMIALILMQRGAGAQAGSGFGGGASATVFGARGSANFLSKATKWLGITFFAITLAMAWQVTRSADPGIAQQDLGVMSQVPAAPVQAPASDTSTIPTAPAQGVPAPDVPAAPAQPGSQSPQPAQQAQPAPVPQED